MPFHSTFIEPRGHITPVLLIHSRIIMMGDLDRYRIESPIIMFEVQYSVLDIFRSPARLPCACSTVRTYLWLMISTFLSTHRLLVYPAKNLSSGTINKQASKARSTLQLLNAENNRAPISSSGPSFYMVITSGVSPVHGLPLSETYRVCLKG